MLLARRSEGIKDDQQLAVSAQVRCSLRDMDNNSYSYSLKAKMCELLC